MHLTLLIVISIIGRGSSDVTDRIRAPIQNRMPNNIIRRLYGKGNAAIRNELHKIQQTSTGYWRTGIRGDPNFKIEYENHPFDRLAEHRRKSSRHLELDESHALEISEVDANLYRNLNTNVEFAPMRIKFATGALETQRDDDNDDKVDFIINEILPRMGDFWSNALSVVPISGNLIIQANELANKEFCGDSEFTKVPSSHFTTGVEDADLIFYVSGQPSTRFCAPSTLAVAVACNFDQFDRPIAGAINFCLEQVILDDNGSAHPESIDDNVDVAIHEAAHILGMSSNSYRYFWDPETGEPRTTRGFVQSTVECVDGVERTLYLPDENTLKFDVASNGQRYASIVTKTVVTVVRNQFDCQSLDGAQLENQPTGTDSCTGDHWDERLFYPEALSGVISSSTNILSPLTLGLLEDSGWYKANFTMSSVSPWGHGSGCDFVEQPCLVTNDVDDVVVPDYGRGYFCTQGQPRGCSPSHHYKMGCTLIDYSIFSDNAIPDIRFQYFPSAPELGGPQQADYCPLYGSSYKNNVHNLDCRNSDNGFGLGIIYSEYYGEKSSCFETANSGEARCYEARCIKNEFAIEINIRGEWHTCAEDFQKIQVKVSDTGLLPLTIICPRLSSACPDMFCPANCAGRGVCNFTANINGTIRPKCNCFNETDTSLGCAETLPLDGRYLDDSSGLLDDLEDTIFDALIAVFVDEPNTWSNASWCWASGLFILFLLIIFCICSSCISSKSQMKRIPRSDESDL